jgi:cell division protein FtsB
MAKHKNWYWPQIWSIVKNKFVLTTLGFVIWLGFFDKNDFLTTHSYRQKLHQLQAERDYYEVEIEKNKAYLEHLETNPDNLERFAREKYLMKKDNEEIFVIVQEKPEQE